MRTIGALALALLVTLTIAACGSGDSKSTSTSANSYLDKQYGFSVELPPRFAGDWWQGRVDSDGGYYKAWTTADSPVRDNQPLDYFGVSVLKEEPRTPAQIDAEIRASLSSERDVAAALGHDARVLRVHRTTVDCAEAVTIYGYITDPKSGFRERMRWTEVLTEHRTYSLVGVSTPRTWRHNLPAFEAILPSFRLPEEE